MREFRLDRKHITLMKWGLVVFLALLALGLALLLFPGENIGNSNQALIATFMCTVVFGFSTVLTWLTLKKLPFVDVAMDDDGIWYMHIGKDDGLIRWGQIYKVKERAYLQCLDLINSSGERLLRVEYQLNGFEVIRHALNEKTFNSNQDIKQSTFSKNLFYHLFYLASVLGFSALGFYVGSNGNPLLGYGAMSVLVALIIYEYLITATGIHIGKSNFVIVYPFTNKSVPFSDVENILLTDEFHKGNRIPEVWIVSKNAKKPFKLKQIGADSNVIYKALRQGASL